MRRLFRLAGLIMLLSLALAARAHDNGHGPLPQPPVLAQAAANTDAPSGTTTCMVALRAADAATGETIPALIHITDAQGRTIRPAELLPRTMSLSPRSLGEAAYAYMDRWFVLPGERRVALPQGAVKITAFSGLESTLASLDLELSGKSSAIAEIELTRFHDASAGGERAGNVHLHLKDMSLAEAERYITETAPADGLDLVFFSYLERADADRTYISNTFTKADLARFREKSGVLFGYGEEYRHNFPGEAGYGHVMFLDLPRLILPASFGPDITKQGNDDGVLRTGIEAARRRGATVLWCHNAWGHEDIPSWVAGLLHGQIVFDGGAEGGYEQGFYNYLNIGLRVPIAMGTDWSLSDMAVTLVPLDGPPSTEGWLAALRAGRSYITNGPMLEFTADGARPGDEIAPDIDNTVRVNARGVCRNDFGALELVVNGEVAARAETRARDGYFESRLALELPLTDSAWLAVRAAPFYGDYGRPEAVSAAFNEYGKPLFAHTSPVYVTVDGKPVFVREAAERLIAELRSSMVIIRRAGVYSSDRERDHVLAIYEEARDILVSKLAR